MTNHGGVSGEHIRSFVARIERLNEEKAAIAEDIKEIYAEVKSIGFDVKVLKTAIKRRKMSESDRQEMDALLDVYEHAIGFDTTPLGQAADELEAANDAIEKTVGDMSKKGITITIGKVADESMTDKAPSSAGGGVVADGPKIVGENITRSKADIQYDEAVELVTKCNKASCALLQRQMKIGYNKAATIIEQMENDKIISPPNSSGQRKILIKQAAE